MFSKKSTKWIIGLLIFGLSIGTFVVVRTNMKEKEKDEIKWYVAWYGLYVNQITEFQAKKYELIKNGDDAKTIEFIENALKTNQELLTDCQKYEIPKKDDILNNYSNILKISQVDYSNYKNHLEYLKTKDIVYLKNASNASNQLLELRDQAYNELQIITAKYLN